VDRILDRMKVHDEWHERYLIEYRAQRNFHAANLTFEEEATLEVRATFRQPDTIESQVLRAEGSRLIRERVFDNILKAENETHSKQAKQQVDIVPANYSFSYIGQGLYGDQKCYRLGITPRRREKYLIQGQIWVDAEDWSIVRILGSPAKRPSLWTRQTEICHFTHPMAISASSWFQIGAAIGWFPAATEPVAVTALGKEVSRSPFSSSTSPRSCDLHFFSSHGFERLPGT
jgi:hypothetical protein